MVPGQSNVAITTDNFNLKLSYSSTSAFSGCTLGPGTGDGNNSPSIQFSSSGLGACSGGGSYLKVAVAQWSSVPYTKSSQLTSPILHFSSDPLSDNNKYESGLNESTSVEFNISLPFTSVQRYNATSMTFENATFPSCVQRGEAAEFASIYAKEWAQIASILGHPVVPSLDVSILVACMGFVILCGTFYSLRLEKRDRLRIKDTVDKVHQRRAVKAEGVNSPMLSESGLYLETDTSLATNTTNKWNDVIRKSPFDELSLKTTIIGKFCHSIQQNHYAISFLFGEPSVKRTRTLRFLNFCLVALLHLFFNTIIFGVLYPADNGK